MEYRTNKAEGPNPGMGIFLNLFLKLSYNGTCGEKRTHCETSYVIQLVTILRFVLHF